jgi:hypothetical protein
MLPFLLTIPGLEVAQLSPVAVASTSGLSASSGPPAGPSAAPADVRLVQSFAADRPSPVPSPAERPSRSDRGYPYLSVQGGLALVDELNGKEFALGDRLNFRFNPGANVEAALGYRFANNTRLEVGVGYLSANASSFSTLPENAPVVDGEAVGRFALTSVLMNAIIDFPIIDGKGRRQPITPYLGAGLGYGSLTLPHCPQFNDSTCLKVDPVGTLVYQFKLGASLQVAVKSSVFAEAAYVGVPGATVADDLSDISYNRMGAYRFNLGFRQGF